MVKVLGHMPVILDPDAYDAWLDPGMTNADAASELLKPCDARLMRCYPVSTRINHVANGDEECSAPVEPQGSHQKRPTVVTSKPANGSGLGQGCFTPSPPEEASLFSCASSVDRI